MHILGRKAILFLYIIFSTNVLGVGHSIQMGTSGVFTTVLISDPTTGSVYSDKTGSKDDFGKDLPLQTDSICSSLKENKCTFLQGDVPTLSKASRPLTKSWLKNLKKGDKVDALDYTNNWFTAEITKISGGPKYKIHFDDWESKWDEEMLWNSGRLAKHKTHAKGGRLIGGILGQKIIVDELPETEYDPLPKKKTQFALGGQTNLVSQIQSALTNLLSQAQGEAGSDVQVTTQQKQKKQPKKKKFKDPKMEEFLNSLQIGQQIDGLDGYGMWFTGRVVKINGDKAYIKFDDWEDKWSEWIDRFSGRITRYKTIAKGGQHSGGVKHPRLQLFKPK